MSELFTVGVESAFAGVGAQVRVERLLKAVSTGETRLGFHSPGTVAGIVNGGGFRPFPFEHSEDDLESYPKTRVALVCLCGILRGKGVKGSVLQAAPTALLILCFPVTWSKY